MKSIKKEYTNGEVTIVWSPDLCIHSGNCFRGLNEVFDPRKRPWVTPNGISSDRIVDQINKCPSGALSYYMNKNAPATENNKEVVETVIEATANGPLLVHGSISIKDRHGVITKKEKTTALCRCGGSANKPYCDGTHKQIHFEG